MIISINFPTPSTSKLNPTLPPQLAKIGHDEVVLVELQGVLEVECNSPSERDGKPVGILRIDESGTKPTLTIGHHLLEGKIATLPKPLAVLFRTPQASLPPKIPYNRSEDENDPNCEDVEMMSEASGEFGGNQGRPSWDVVAIVKRKILFSKRPMPVLAANASR